MRLCENQDLSIETALPQKAHVHQGSIVPLELKEVDLVVIETNGVSRRMPW